MQIAPGPWCNPWYLPDSYRGAALPLATSPTTHPYALLPSWLLVLLYVTYRLYRVVGRRDAVRGSDGLAVLMLAALGIGYMDLDPQLHPWDERFHALVARNLAADPLWPRLYRYLELPFDYRGWGGNAVWLHKQPLTLWLQAATIRLLGAHTWAVRLPSLLLSLAGVSLTWALGRRLFGRRTAFVAAFLYATNGLLLELASGRAATDHVDTAFTVAVLAGAYAAVRGRHYAGGRAVAGLCAGLAVLTKWLTGLLPLALLAVLLPYGWRSVSKLLLPTLLAVAVFLPWQLYIHAAFPAEAGWEQAYNTRHLFEALEGHAGGWWWHLDRLRRSFGETVFLTLALAVATARAGDGRHRWLLVYLGLPLLFFSLAATKMPAYLAVAYPAVCLLTARAVMWCATGHPRLPRRLTGAVAVLLLALPLRYGVERLKPLHAATPAPTAWYAEVAGYAAAAARTGERVVVFGDPDYVSTMFYFPEVVSYPFPLTAGRRAYLGARAYQIVVRQTGR